MNEEIDEDMIMIDREEEIEQQIILLKAKLKENPFDYECHMELIKNLKLLNDMDELEKARLLFSSLFPLSADIWLDWIGDEKLMISSIDEKKKLVEMYLLAVKDYQDISIWKSLYEYLLEECSNDEEEPNQSWLNLDDIRKINKTALKAMRRHYIESHIIFSSVMQIELLFLEKNPEHKVHIEFARSQYMELLAIPHQEVDETFSAYSAFESIYGSKSYESYLKAATKIVSKSNSLNSNRDICESDLRASDYSLQSFYSYIGSVKKWKYKQKSVTDQSFEEEIKAIYERAIKIYYWDSSLWISYLSFLSSVQPELIDRKELAAISAHAVMSSFACMSNPDLWSLHLVIQESAGKSWEELEESFTQGVSFIMAQGDIEKLTLFLVFVCGTAGRLISDQAELLELFEMFQEYQKSMEKAVCSNILQTTIARIIASKFKNESVVNEIFSKIRHDCNSFLAWASTMIESFKNYGKARSVYKQAVKRPLDGSERLYQSWMDFELVHGSHNDVEKCLAAISLAREKDAQNFSRKNLPAENLIELPATQNEVVEDSLKGEKRVREDSNDPESDPKKVKKEDNRKIGDISSYKVIPNADAGNMAFLGNLPGSASLDSLLPLVSNYGKIVDLFLYPNTESGQLEALVEFQSAEAVRKFVLDGAIIIGEQNVFPKRCRPEQLEWSYSGEEVKDTVYVSNLTAHVNKIELRDLFGQFGNIKEIRFPKTHGQKNYSYAYIQFFNKESASQSLILNNHECRAGWKIGVAISNPHKRTVHEADKKRLFVSNLAESILEEDLKELFSPCGAIGELRLLKDDSGNSKCAAYVSFATEEEASNGLKLNGSRLDNRIIIVSIADPNKKKDKSSTKSSAKSAKSTNKRGFAPRSGSNNVDTTSAAPIPKLFAPRSTMARRNPKSLVSITSTTSDTKTPVYAASSGGKTQDDFRNLFSQKDDH